MQTFLTILKWIFWIAAGWLAGLFLFLTLLGKGISDITDLLLSLLYCAVIAFPGLLIHLMQEQR